MKGKIIECPNCHKNISEIFKKKLQWEKTHYEYYEDIDQFMWHAIDYPTLADKRNGYYCSECDKLIATSIKKLQIIFRNGTLNELKQ